MWNCSWEEAVFVIFCLSCCRCFHTKELFDHFCDILSVGKTRLMELSPLLKAPEISWWTLAVPRTERDCSVVSMFTLSEVASHGIV